jgi:hypothetical protein
MKNYSTKEQIAAFEKHGHTNLCDLTVGRVAYIKARPMVYCGQFQAFYLRRWAEELERISGYTKWASKDVRVYAQYSEHSDSFALIALPIINADYDKRPLVVTGLRENDFKYH